MQVDVLIDNEAQGGLHKEHGLALLVTYGGKKILLDSGDSALFMQNAAAMQIDLNEVSYAVLSHSHSDHANGFGVFFQCNNHAPLYARESISDAYYLKMLGRYQAVGVDKALLETYAARIVRVDGRKKLQEGVGITAYNTGLGANCEARTYVSAHCK